MPALSQRLSITCESELFSTLTKLSKKNNKSLSVIAKDLIVSAIKKNEDLFFSDLAKKRDKKNTKTFNHQEAWK